MSPGAEADRVLLAHMRDCLDRIGEYTQAERARFDASRLVQDAVMRNLQTLTESNRRLSGEIKATEPQIPWRELAGLLNLIVHGYLGVDLGAVWLVVAGRRTGSAGAGRGRESHGHATRLSRVIPRSTRPSAEPTRLAAK